MKDLRLLIWLTQLGLSTAVPLAGFVLLAIWLRNRFGLGIWVVLVGIGVGIICALDGFYKSLKILSTMDKKQEDNPPISYTEHD